MFFVCFFVFPFGLVPCIFHLQFITHGLTHSLNVSSTQQAFCLLVRREPEHSGEQRDCAVMMWSSKILWHESSLEGRFYNFHVIAGRWKDIMGNRPNCYFWVLSGHFFPALWQMPIVPTLLFSEYSGTAVFFPFWCFHIPGWELHTIWWSLCGLRQLFFPLARAAKTRCFSTFTLPESPLLTVILQGNTWCVFVIYRHFRSQYSSECHTERERESEKVK